MLMITRSEAGISLFTRDGKRFDFPVRSKEVKDVTGAGDTVLAMVSVALANGLDIKYGAQLAISQLALPLKGSVAPALISLTWLSVYSNTMSITKCSMKSIFLPSKKP